MKGLLHSLLLVTISTSLSQGAIVISDLTPQDGSTISTVDGSVTVSAVVTETETSISAVHIDFRADGTRMFSLRSMSQVSGTDRYEYDVGNLMEGVEYCFRIRAKNSADVKKWSSLPCFHVGETPSPSMLPTTQPTAYPTANPTAYPTANPTAYPTANPTAYPTANPTSIETSSIYDSITYGLQPDCYEEDSSKFSICLDLTSASGEVEPFMAYFAGARDKWEKVIISNGLYYTNTGGLNKAYTATGSYPSVIDGVYISSYIKSIDGKRGVLGSAGPVYVMTKSGIRRPLTGRMNFDADDLDWMDADGILEGVIKHEMGHVLGIGTMWKSNGLVNYPDGDLYLGSNVLSAWSAQGCEFVNSGAPIVEMDGGGGTAGGHFDEKCFDEELMTGYVDQGMVLSFLTVASLADMGYGVNFGEAEEFSLAGSCCSSGRRNLRGNVPTKRRFSERRLTPENKATAIAFGKSELRRLRDNQYDIGLDSQLAIMDTINVYMLQDGHVIDIEVSMEDAIPL